MHLKNIFKLVIVAAAAIAFDASATGGINVSSSLPTITQNFDSMWDGSAPTLALPEGWRVDRNLDGSRRVGSFAAASTEVMYTGGVSLATNAKNGTYSFGSSSEPSDRAIGGLTTTVSNGTRCVNVMTCLTNADANAITRLKVSYDIEKYRKCANDAGFAVQMYYSLDGTNWVSAGDAFYTLFEKEDTAANGAAIVPIDTTSVTDAVLMAEVAAGTDIYLAWNISVASGSSPDKAPGLSVDNIEVTATFYDPSMVERYLYVEDVTGWNAIYAYAEDDSMGAYPGSSSEASKNVNGVAYKAFAYTGACSVVLNNSAVNLPAITLDGSRDYYVCATADEVTEIANPDSYTGWVDPNFTPSGIYLRGEINSWGASADWEFSNDGNGVYTLHNKTLSGAFKVADASWSSTCNYGSNGSAITPDTDYALVKGTDANISCGNFTMVLKDIILTIDGGNATLRLVSNDDATGLTTVYIIGDNNGWNYMNADGALALDSTDGLFKGRVSMLPGADGRCHWRIYQRLGMGGSWGAEGGVDATEAATEGTLVKGSTGNMVTPAGTYDVTFDITTGAFAFSKVSAAIVDMKFSPAATVLVPNVPEQVKVLSLNNSLIYYNTQSEVFNNIAAAMGYDAHWTMHTNLGKTLDYHWSEGEGVTADGQPGAKMLIRSEAWTHIILQEQTALPRTDVETFRASVKKWVAYIRENCPNPNAVIILPMNWAYQGDWTNFSDYNKIFEANYLDVAADAGVIIVPVGKAYQAIYDAEGIAGTDTLFQDDRHPTDKSTYLAALMEYAAIFNADPREVTWAPNAVSAADAASMRDYAAAIHYAFTQAVNHHDATIRFAVSLLDEYGIEVDSDTPVEYTIDGGGTITDGVFVSDGTLGTYHVTAKAGAFTRNATITVAEAETEVITYPAIQFTDEALTLTEDFDSLGTAAEAEMPQGWRIDRQTGALRQVGTFAAANEATMYAGGVNLASNAKNGIWNFGTNAGDDRAVGGITTGVADGSRAINVYAHLYNAAPNRLTNITLSYDVEKYRKGNNAAGFAVKVYYSLDGRNWTALGDDFYTYLAPDSETKGYAEVPGETHSVAGTLPFDFFPGCDLYLAWNISAASGDNGAGAMALAIDNVTIAGEYPKIPQAKHYVYAHDLTGWDSLGLYAWGDSELFGAWPGIAPAGTITADDKTFKVFPMDTEGGNYNLIFNNYNNGQQAPDYAFSPTDDLYVEVTSTRVTPLTLSDVEAAALADNIFYASGAIYAPNAASITVYSLGGITVAHAEADCLDICTLAPGVYIARAGHLTLKIVK